MSQNYSELRKDNVRDAIYEDVANNLEVLRTSWAGNSFPENPKAGQACYRIDEDKLYYWNGTEWAEKGGGGAPRETGGVEIGDIGFAPLGIDESLNLRRYLNGQVISQSQFVSFTNKLKSAVALYPSLATTETNWQSEKNLSKLGQCGRFVIDDDAGTIRLPCVVNAQSLTDLQYLGTIKSESLPNISGAINGVCVQNATGNTYGTGAFVNAVVYENANVRGTSAGSLANFPFSASESSSTYQDNVPVQQEAVQYPYYIQVATGIEETLPAIREYKTNVPYVLGDSKYSETNPYNASWLVSNGQYNAKATYPDMWTQLQVELNSSLNKGDTVIIDGKTYVKRGLPVKISTDTITDYDWVVNTSDETFRLPLLNGDRVLVKKHVSGNDWYNLYSDGWLEQGAVQVATSTTGEQSFNLLMPYKNTNYSIFQNVYTGSGDMTVRNAAPVLGKRLVDSFTVQSTPAYSGTTFSWVTFGYATVPTSSDFTEVSGLYYYVGDTVQDASLINAGAVLGQLSNKVDLTSTQHISGKKYIKDPVLAKQSDLEGGQIYFEKSGNDVCGEEMYIDRFQSQMRFIGYNEDGALRIPVKIAFNGGGRFYGNYPPVNMNAGVAWSIPTSNKVVPGNGIFFLQGRNSNGTGSTIWINDKVWSYEWNGSQYNFFRHIPVLVGDNLRMSLGGGTTEFALTFYPYL